ncbi:MAG: PRC-barrel domain-containing protein [Bacteroidota bacterium]|nr:PRC-barrel domain-containing protein [Bacteroidota bacterium]
MSSETETVVVNENLKELSSSGYEMVKGEPDIRGWKVLNLQNVQIGKVKELLFDVESKKVRYLIVDLDGKPINLLSRDIVLPIGLAELDGTESIIHIHDVTVGHLAALPEYKKGKITYQIERDIRNVFIPQNDTAADKLANFESREKPERDAFYNNEFYDENRLYKRRRPENKIVNKEDDHDREKVYNEKYIRSNDQDTGNKKTEENVIYIPDENDPNILRKAKIIKETPND